MNNPIFYRTLCLDWEQVAQWGSSYISSVLSRQVVCKALPDAPDYWSYSLPDDYFSIYELCMLLESVQASPEIYRATLPDDSNRSRDLSAALSEAILGKILHASWECSLAKPEHLLLIRVPGKVKLPTFPTDIYYLGSKEIDCSKLWSKDDLLENLFSRDGTFSTFADLCERYVQDFGIELYWYYPITDGFYNGVYFVLVQEGVLCLPYNAVDLEDHEWFDEQGARLVNAEGMGYFIASWKEFSDSLMSAMSSLLRLLKSKEAANG